ncbi:SNF2 helicase associated domain-containing protein, partial [Clostridium sp.]
MDLNEMLDLILLSGSKISRIEGKRLYQNKLVSDIKGKKIESIYHIYGKVKDEKIDKYYNVHIKVDLRNKKMAGGNCSCEDYIENKNLHRDFKCKHMMAVAYKFYMLAKKDKKKKGTKEPIKIEKIQVRIEPRLKAIKENGIEKYIAEFWIGDNSLALMKSINEFIYCMENKRFLSLNDNFVYNPHKHILNEEAERIISYINKKISSKDSKEKRIIGRYFEIKAQDLKEFLMLLENNKSIFFNYDYVNYKAEVIKEMLPIHFNIKLKEEKISVTTTNKMPIPLNNSLEVFLYDRKIYLPNEEQIKFLKVIYKPLMDKGQVILANNEENLVKILRILSNITEDISLGEGVKRLVTSLIKPEFYFTKVNDDIYCKVDINYSIGKITLLKDINKLSFIRDNIYEEKIVMEMEKLKFIRDDSKFKFIGEDEDIYNLLSVRFKELLKEGKVYLTKDFKDIRLIKGKDLDYSFIEEDEGYYFKVKGFTIKELNSALHDMKNKKGFYKTKNNNYLDLKDKTVIRILNILDSLDISDDNITIDKNKMLYINESLKNQGTAFDKGEETIKELDKGLSNRQQREVPDDLNAKLRNYQVEGFNWLNEIANLKVGGILADEMGLGKTIQIIAFLLSQKGKKSIVITPTSLIYNWRDEFNKFAPSLNVGIIH